MKKNKNVLILGGDGYIGYPLSIYLIKKGYKVISVDNFLRRNMVSEIGSHSAIPLHGRLMACDIINADIRKFETIKNILATYKPDAIVHLAEQSSAPYSMISPAHAEFTQQNNVINTLNLLWAMKQECPKAHLLKLATMGEYGTPDINITEGPIEIKYKGRKDKFQFPKQAGSFYHLSKVFDSQNIEFACKNWGLISTDINQGPVYGSRIDEMNENHRTRFDFDHVFGTVINRFCTQAIIGFPLTVYGKGEQTRGYININDSVQAIELCIQNPSKGYRVINQIVELFTVNEIAQMVKEEGKKIGLDVKITHIENPRKEKEEHYYNPEFNELKKLGLKPQGLRKAIIPTLKDLIKYKDRILQKKDFISPTIKWENKQEYFV